MMFKIGGYRQSTGNIGVESFNAKITQFSAMVSPQYDIHIIPEFTPISNQGLLNSCVGNAVADCFEILKGLEDPAQVQQISRLFLYYDARNYTGETNVDNGCYIHNALNSLTKLGACREIMWEYNINNVFVQPPLEAYREASDNTISSFFQITATGADRINQIELAIRANHPVIFGTRVSSEFQNYNNGTDKVFSIPTDDVGGHAMIIVGVRTNAAGQKEFYVRNSWGNTFGLQGVNAIGQSESGHCWVSADYMAWAQTNDIFVATRMPNLLV